MASNHTISLWTARCLPVAVLGIIAYVSYAFVKEVCVDHLLYYRLKPTATGLLVGYSILLLFLLTTYLRILESTLFNEPGYVARSGKFNEAQRQKQKSHRKRRKSHGNKSHANGHVSANKEKLVGANPVTGSPYTETIESHRPDADSVQPGLAYFYNKDVFVCEGDGRPPWCTVCMDWKPDRTHHCSEVKRCVRKMDHFCPWVGGMVSEVNFKYFFQFVAWASLYCLYVLIAVATLLVDSRSLTGKKLPSAHWAVVIGLSGFFFIFAAGMTFTTLNNILHNSTSVEELSRTVKKWSLAVYLPYPPGPGDPCPFQMVTFPHTPSQHSHETSTIPTPRTFAILYSEPGENPFDLGTYENFTSVMGDTVWDWVLPLRRSPCCDHSSDECDWPLGPVYDKMRNAYGLGKR